MLEKFYAIYRTYAIDGIISFMIFLVTLYFLCGIKEKKLTALYFAAPTLIFLPTFMGLGKLFSFYSYWYYFVLLTILPFISAIFLLKRSTFTKILYTLFFVSVYQMFKVLLGPLYDAEKLMDNNLYALLDMTSALAIDFLIILFSLYLNKLNLSPNLKPLPFKPYMLFVFPSSLLIGFIVCFAFVPYKYHTSIMGFIMLINIPVICKLFSMLIASYEEKKKLDEALTLSHAEIESFKTSHLQREELKKERHELKNKYFYIETLLKQKKYDEAEKFIKQTIGDFELNLSHIETGNTFLDYLLNKKILEAKQYGITTVTEIYVPNTIKIDEVSLCTILSNLLDNAIEYSKDSNGKEIRLKIVVSQNYLSLTVKNRIDSDIIKTNPLFATTKKDSANHGYGLKIIQSTISQINGIFHTEADSDYFTAQAMLPLGQ